MRPRISIRGCVRPSVGRYVCHAFVKNARNWNYVQKWYWRHRKPWITQKQLSSISTTKGGYCRTQISSSHLSHLCKRICPKMLEDASLAAGPCFRYNSVFFLIRDKATLSERLCFCRSIHPSLHDQEWLSLTPFARYQTDVRRMISEVSKIHLL